MSIPCISELPERPILQTMASTSSWVRVVFYKDGGITRDEIYRTMEMLAMMYNGWDSKPLPESEQLPAL